jgi:hypothetical protein
MPRCASATSTPASASTATGSASTCSWTPASTGTGRRCSTPRRPACARCSSATPRLPTPAASSWSLRRRRRGRRGAGPPTTGFFLLSFFVDVDDTLERLTTLGFGGRRRRIDQPGPGGPVPMATVRDPDGVLVELIQRRRPGA